MKRRDRVDGQFSDEELAALGATAEARFAHLPNEQRIAEERAWLAEFGVTSLDCLQAAIRVRRARHALDRGPLLPEEPRIVDGQHVLPNGLVIDDEPE